MAIASTVRVAESELKDAAAEGQRVDSVSRWYVEKQLDFDRRMIHFRYRSIQPFLAALKGGDGLELGTADGVMTRLLLSHSRPTARSVNNS